jgi:predicted patatin/cPLA2 family phospholipase
MRGGHLIDLDWYFDAISLAAPLDIDRGQRRLQGRSLLICASRCDTLAASHLPFRADTMPLAAKASSAVPLFYRTPVALKGVDYWDGGITDALPVEVAHAMGNDCIVVIRTQPRAPSARHWVLPNRLTPGRLKTTADHELASKHHKEAAKQLDAGDQGAADKNATAAIEHQSQATDCSKEAAKAHPDVKHH